MTFADIRDAVKSRAGRSDSTANAKAQEAVDAALRAIEAEGNWYWMEATATATAPATGTTDRIAIPSGPEPPAFKELRQPLQWEDTTNKQRISLEEISEGEANARYTSDDKGDPVAFRLWKGQFFIYPPKRDTDAVIRVPYWGWTPGIDWSVNSGESNEVSNRWAELWIARGCIEYFRMIREFAAAQVWMGTQRPEPGTYLYELLKLRRANNRMKLPEQIGAHTGSARPGSARADLGYPWWGRAGH